MKTLPLFAIVALLSWTCEAATFKVDPSHSNVHFTVRHLVSKVTGGFKDFEGTFTFDEKKPTDAKGTFTAKVASINTDNEKRDAHLRGDDFFAADKNPELKLDIKKITKGSGRNKYKASGDITMRGVTKPITLDVEYMGTAEMGPQTRAGFVATGKVNRKDFGINWNKALDKGGFVLGDDVSLNLQVEAIEEKEAKAEEAKK